MVGKRKWIYADTSIIIQARFLPGPDTYHSILMHVLGWLARGAVH